MLSDAPVRFCRIRRFLCRSWNRSNRSTAMMAAGNALEQPDLYVGVTSDAQGASIVSKVNHEIDN